MDKPSLNIVRAADIAAHSQEFSHPWNPNSELHGTQLARSVGLKRTGVTFVRVPAGKESYVYHSHLCEEEWIYVLSGKAIALIDDAEYEVNAGDFIGFPAPSVAHHMSNPGPGDLVTSPLVVTGEINAFEGVGIFQLFASDGRFLNVETGLGAMGFWKPFGTSMGFQPGAADTGTLVVRPSSGAEGQPPPEAVIPVRFR